MALQDSPTKPQFRITHENARELALLSHAPNSARHQLKADRAEIPQDILVELKIVEEQIAQARKTLNDDTPYCPACEREALQPQHRAQLMKALDAFLDRRRILLNRPLPGSLRPSNAKGNRRNAESPNPVTDPTPANGETPS